MKRIIVISTFLIFSVTLPAQVTNTGLPIGISGNTTVAISGGDFTSQGDVSNEGTLIMDQDLTISGTYSGAGEIALTGGNQNIDVTNAIQSLTVSNGDKTMLSDLTVSDLTFTNGRILSNSNNLEVSGTITGADNASHVVGRLIRSGNTTLDFPISDGTTYAPVILSEITGTTPSIAVEMIAGDPQAIAGNSLLAVSANRYWDIAQAGGSFTSAKVQLPVINESVAPSIGQLAVAYGTGTSAAFSGSALESTTGNLTSGTITAANSLPPGLFAIGRYFDQSLRTADSVALVNIYNSTIGNSWTDDTGWLGADLPNWAGVTISQKRVTGLDLSQNNLTQTFPTISSGLEAMTNLDISGNELTAIGNISSLTSLQTVNVSSNRLQFGSLEGVVAAQPGAIYAPQKEVLAEIRTLRQIGETYTVDRTVTGSANAYSWIKNGAAIAQTTPSFDVFIEDFTADGNYVARVTNTNVPGLTITTTPVKLRVSSLARDSASLIAVYEAIVTDQSNITNWTTTDITDWPEITIGANDRVTAVNLSGRNLSGELPVDITDIEGLQTVDLSNNRISGLPELPGTLPNVTNFNVSSNNLDFGDLEPNVSFSSLNYASQKPFGSALNTVIPNGENFPLGFTVGGAANRYQWFLSNDLLTNQAVGGANASNYTIESIGYENMGTYVLRVTNTVVPGLTLESRTQKVLASADLTFTAIGQNSQPLDGGVGYALKVTAPGVPFDSITPPAEIINGRFTYEGLILGDYLIAAEASDLETYLPTYFESTDLWTEASTLELRADFSDTLFMAFIPPPLPPRPDGGIVDGTVESDFEDDTTSTGGRIDARRKVKRAGCSVRRFVRSGRDIGQDGSFVLYAYVQSDDEGRFNFTDLEAGLYRFNIEYPGIPMDPNSFVEFEIEEGVENNKLVLQATVTEDGIIVEKIDELGFYRKYFKDLDVFPNPAHETLTLRYAKLLSEDVVVRLMDLEGRVVLEERINKGYDQEMTLDVSDVSDGIYLLHFVDYSLNSKSISTFKVFVRHR